MDRVSFVVRDCKVGLAKGRIYEFDTHGTEFAASHFRIQLINMHKPNCPHATLLTNA